MKNYSIRKSNKSVCVSCIFLESDYVCIHPSYIEDKHITAEKLGCESKGDLNYIFSLSIKKILKNL